MSTQRIFDLYEEFRYKIPIAVLEQTPLNAWEEYEKQGIKKPENLDEAIINYHKSYFDCFDRILKYYDKQEKLNLGVYSICNFNAEANTVNGQKTIIVDEFLLAFFIQFLLGLYHLTYDQKVPLTEIETEKCKQYLQFEFELFYFRNLVRRETKTEFDNFFDFIVAKNYQFAYEASIGALAIYYFIVAHELGHHYYNHAANSKEKDKYRHAKEYEADTYAYKMVKNVIEDENLLDHTSVLPEFSKFPLLMFDILNIYYQITPNSISNNDTHPKPLDRKTRLEEAFKNSMNSKGDSIYYDLLETLNELKFNEFDKD
jgi:uncharacterized protein YggL (DUF469 family)